MAQKVFLFSWIYCFFQQTFVRSAFQALCWAFLLIAPLNSVQAQEGTPEVLTKPGAEEPHLEAVLREPMAGAGAQNMLITPGKVKWSLEKQGDNGEVLVRGVIDFPEINFHLDLTFRRNLSKDLSASHIFSLIFSDKSAQPTRKVKDFAGIELRVNPASAGKYLKGLSIPLEPEAYAIALFNSEFDIKSNVELLQEYDWFTFPVMFSSGRTGFVFFAKGVDGDKIFKEAFSAWSAQ